MDLGLFSYLHVEEGGRLAYCHSTTMLCSLSGSLHRLLASRGQVLCLVLKHLCQHQHSACHMSVR